MSGAFDMYGGEERCIEGCGWRGLLGKRALDRTKRVLVYNMKTDLQNL
jgi:hypothetical protein